MNTIGNEGNGRNLPLFNAIKSTGTSLERDENPKPKKATAAAPASPPTPPKPPKKNKLDFGKKEPAKDDTKRKPDEGSGGLVRNK